MVILWKWEMPKVGNMDLFKNCCRFMLTFRGETWAHAKADVTIPTAAEMRLVRSTEGKPQKRERE
jgi:hypothetical protein